MECGKDVKRLPKEDGTMRLLVKVKFPRLQYGVIEIAPGERDMCFEYDAELGRFIEASNGVVGGYLQYRDEDGVLYELDSDSHVLS